jgi:hypothetical protein
VDSFTPGRVPCGNSDVTRFCHTHSYARAVRGRGSNSVTYICVAQDINDPVLSSLKMEGMRLLPCFCFLQFEGQTRVRGRSMQWPCNETPVWASWLAFPRMLEYVPTRSAKLPTHLALNCAHDIRSRDKKFIYKKNETTLFVLRLHFYIIYCIMLYKHSGDEKTKDYTIWHLSCGVPCFPYRRSLNRWGNDCGWFCEDKHTPEHKRKYPNLSLHLSYVISRLVIFLKEIRKL